MTDAPALVGTCDIALVTLDTLRYDVAVEAMAAGETPTFAGLFTQGWEERHSPGSFTYAAHRAFFAGFLPTPARPGRHERPFALRFPGADTVGPSTSRLGGSDVVGGLAQKGYRTICVGGVGFFNPGTPLGADLTGLFQEAYWRPEFGASARRGFEAQIACLEQLDDGDERLRFTFVNVASLHRPKQIADQRAALASVDRHFSRLLRVLTARHPCWLIVCSDHGTAYGEDGYAGHRIGHPVVWTVPYGEAVLARGWSPS